MYSWGYREPPAAPVYLIQPPVLSIKESGVIVCAGRAVRGEGGNHSLPPQLASRYNRRKLQMDAFGYRL